MQVMILAAGRSTRLGELGVMLPKPLVPICGYPAIAFGLALCRRFCSLSARTRDRGATPGFRGAAGRNTGEHF